MNEIVGGQSPRAAIPFHALVLDARLRQSLVTVRSLGRRGLRVAALETSAMAPAFSSRFCRLPFICEAGLGAPAYLAVLEALLADTGAGVGMLIPAHDGTLALLR